MNQSNLEKELKEKKYQLQTAELLALQNQINPHFFIEYTYDHLLESDGINRTTEQSNQNGRNPNRYTPFLDTNEATYRHLKGGNTSHAKLY